MTARVPTGDEVAYHAPETVDAVLEHLSAADGGATVVAGGQTVALLLQQGFLDTDVLVDIGRIDSLRGVSLDDGVSTIGATTTYAELAAHPLSRRVAMLGEACAAIADRQVRNLGTVGGALSHADPALDIVAPLLCLESELRIVHTDGDRVVPLSAFLVGHLETDLREAELLEAVRFDASDLDRAGTAYERFAAVEGAWPTAGAAAFVRCEDGVVADVRVGLNSVAETAVRSPAVEDALRGAVTTPTTIASASRGVDGDIDPLDDLSGSADYQRRLARTLVERSLTTAVQRSGGAL